MRKLIAALLLTLIATPAFAQTTCAPIPALPDTERRTEYLGVSASTGPFNVGFQLYGDSTDYGNWIEVWVNGVKKTAVTDYTVALTSGTLTSACRPMTTAQVTFVVAQTGTVEIIGGRRPRRASQVSENRGVTAHDFNQIISDLTAQNRETWDMVGRLLRAPAGETLTVLPPAATRASQIAAYDASGNPTVVPPSSTTPPSPNSVTNGMLAQMGANTTKCNPTGVLASPTDCSVAQMISMLGSFATLNGNNTWTGLNTFSNTTTISGLLASTNTITATGNAFFGSGQPWIDIRAPPYNAVGDGSTNDTTAIQNAINAAAALGVATVYFPHGTSGIYCVNGGVSVTSGVIELRFESYVQLSACGANVTTLTLNAQFSSIRNATIVGPGMIAGAAPTGNALTVGSACTSCSVYDNLIVGGQFALLVNSADTTFVNNVIGSSYGQAVSRVTLSGYFIRNKVDQNYPVSIPAIGATPSARGNTTAYTTGQIVSLAGFYIQATNNGTSGGSPPTLLSYNTNIVDGTVTWKLLAPTTYYGRQYDTNTTQTFSWGEDFSGPYTAGISLTNTGAAAAPQGVNIDGATVGQTFGSGIIANNGNGLIVTNSTITTCKINNCVGISLQSGWSGDATLTNNLIFQNPFGIVLSPGTNSVVSGNKIFASTTSAITVGANVSHFTLINNVVGTSPTWGANVNGITVAAGTSDHYTILGNDTNGASGTTIIDGGTGLDKFVQSAAAGEGSTIKASGITAIERFNATAKTVNFNSANTDTTVPISLPPGVVNYQIGALRIGNCTGATSTTATWGLFSAAAGGGTAIFAAGQAVTVASNAANTNTNSMTVAPATANTQSYNFANLFFRIGTAQGSADTCDVMIVIVPLP